MAEIQLSGKAKFKTKQIEFQNCRQTTWFQAEAIPPKPNWNVLLFSLLVNPLVRVLLLSATLKSLRAAMWNKLKKWSVAVEGQHAYRWTNELGSWLCLYLCKLGHDILIIHTSAQLGRPHLLYLPSQRIIEKMKWASEYEDATKGYCNEIAHLWSSFWVCVLRLMVS